MDTSRAVELIEKSRTVGILTLPLPDKDAALAAEALARALTRRGKTVGLLHTTGLDSLPENASTLRELPLLPKEFVVSVNTARSATSELRYETAEGRLDIILSPKGRAIRVEDISFRDGKIQADAIISFGVADIEAVSGLLTDDPEIFTRTPILAIAAVQQTRPFGEVVLADGRPNTEVCYRLLSSLGESPPDKETATLLLAGILAKTQGLRKSDTAPDTFLAVSELLRAGADFGAAETVSRNERPHALVQLIARAEVRSKLDEDAGIFWSFLTADDFEKTGKSEEDRHAVLAALREEFPRERAIVLVSQNPVTGKIRADVAGSGALLESAEERAGGERNENTLALPQTFENFKDAEDAVRSLLNDAL